MLKGTKSAKELALFAQKHKGTCKNCGKQGTRQTCANPSQAQQENPRPRTTNVAYINTEKTLSDLLTKNVAQKTNDYHPFATQNGMLDCWKRESDKLY